MSDRKRRHKVYCQAQWHSLILAFLVTVEVVTFSEKFASFFYGIDNEIRVVTSTLNGKSGVTRE